MALNFPNSPILNQIFKNGNQSWIWDGVSWDTTGATTLPYAIVGFYPGRVQATTLFIFHVPPWVLYFLPDFGGSYAASDTATELESTFYIMINDGIVGTLTFAAGSRTGSFAMPSELYVQPGDTFKVQTPYTTDLTLADVTFSIVGNR